jgi:hypothetical protein
MKCQKSRGPRWGKLVPQLLRVVIFAYDLHLGRTIARWKGIEEDINLRGSIRSLGYYLGARSQESVVWALKMAPKVQKPKNC